MPKFFTGAIFFVITLIVAHTAIAKEVVAELDGLELLAKLETAPGKNLQKDGVVVLVHGTLAHNKMEIIANLQTALKSQGVNSLAITLSLGLDRRKGMYDCKLEHNHRHTDAPEEIAAWVEWLKARKVTKIYLAGHSRGGNQVALYMADNPDKSVKKAVLIAPMLTTPEKAAAGYEQRYKKPLQPVLDQANKLVSEDRGDELMPDTDFIYCPGARVTASAFVDYYASNPGYYTPGLLASIKQPVLVIAGSEDQVVSGLPAAMQTADMGSARFSVVEGAGHFFRDLYGDDLADMVVEFIE